MKLIVLSCAEAEFVEAVDYYNAQSPGLGYEFAAEVQRTFDRIRRFPEAWPVFSLRGRRCLTGRFPFGVLYDVEENTILIGAIMDLRCDPIRWQQRVDDVFGEPSV